MNNSNTTNFNNYGNMGVGINKGVVNNYNHSAPDKNLVEAFREIQELWDIFSQQTDSLDEDQFAQKLAAKAHQDKPFRKKLGAWGQSVANIGVGEMAKVGGSEIAKRAIPKALSILATLL